ALSTSLWQQVRQALDIRCAAPDAQQWRLARAAILLMGDSGLRREETAGAQRDNLMRSQVNASNTLVWELTVIGKRNRARIVPISEETLNALRVHWHDRGLDFEALEASGPLISPLVHPSTPAMQRKVAQGAPPYHADTLGRLVQRCCRQLAKDDCAFTEEESLCLANLSAHAFRHTFGTHAAAHQMPIDVVQKVMGHMSMGTTSIYVQAEKKRMIEATAAYYARESGECE
ncbi:MAG: Phage integrase family protein, partial [Glomeribacter sp. 1016415]|nr:Phage integrase family protein [Glomeribacter sp. 1016415]